MSERRKKNAIEFRRWRLIERTLRMTKSYSLFQLFFCLSFFFLVERIILFPLWCGREYIENGYLVRSFLTWFHCEWSCAATAGVDHTHSPSLRDSISVKKKVIEHLLHLARERERKLFITPLFHVSFGIAVHTITFVFWSRSLLWVYCCIFLGTPYLWQYQFISSKNAPMIQSHVDIYDA